jgi:ATP-dependent exoDNAse (exonuclease V) beta subunit
MEIPDGDGLSLLLAPSRSAAVANDPIYDSIRDIEKTLEENEARRLLYVATTRAKRELHLLGCVEADEKTQTLSAAKGSLLSLLWPAVESTVAPVLPAVEPPEGTGIAAVRSLRRLPADWSPPPLPAVAATSAQPATPETNRELDISFHWAGRLARFVGTVVHDALAGIARDGLDSWDAARASRERPRLETELRALGVGPEDLSRCADQVEEALQRTVEDERGRWALASSHQEAQGELAVAGIVDDRLVERRIDRTFVDSDGVRWVADFKTSSHSGGGLEAFLDNELERYRGQMREYRELLENLDPGRPIRVGLYFPLMGAWREYEVGLATGAAG